jgi:hypothetical protein
LLANVEIVLDKKSDFVSEADKNESEMEYAVARSRRNTTQDHE